MLRYRMEGQRRPYVRYRKLCYNTYMAKKSVDYQALQTELEAILQQLQSGDISIDDAVPAYERGVAIVHDLEDYLKTAENKITELQAKLEE